MSIFFWKKKKSETENAVESVEAPAQERPEEEAPAQESLEETPAEEEPAEAEPVREREEESVQEPEAEPAEEMPAEEESAREPEAEPAEEMPAEEESAREPEAEPAEEMPAEETPAREPEAESAEEMPAEENREYEMVPAAQEEDSASELAQVPKAETAEVAPPGAVDSSAEEEDYEERRPKRKSRALLWIFLLLLVIGGSYYYGMTYSMTHFLENTYINGMNVSGMTSPEVEKIFSQEAEGYSLKITFRDGEVEVIDGKTIGFKVKPDGCVDRILQSQEHEKWYMCFFRRTDGEVELNTTYDPDRLRQAVAALAELQTDFMVVPSDAYIVLEKTTFSIIPEVEGNLVDVEVVQKAASEAVQKEERDVVVADLAGSYKAPSVRATDADIVEKCDNYNHMLAGAITWNLPNGDSMTLDKETTVNWLSLDENGDYYRDEDRWEENIVYWVDELARKVNTVGSDWSINSHNSGWITVSGGDYGYSVNKVDEREEVWNLLWDGETDEREPYFYSVEYNKGSGLGDTYIEADLSAQHVWIYIDGSVVCDTDCVSGNTSLGRGTPTGVYQILYKDTDVDLKGQQLANGQYSYISHVDYWMPFYGGCGFHDASWRSSFGGTIYKYDGSHGCINLPPSVVPRFYSYVQKGMPVVVHY